MGVPGDALQAAPMAIVYLKRSVIKQQRRETDNSIHRGSELVGDIREESCLSLALKRQAPVLFGKHAVALLEFRARRFSSFGATSKSKSAVLESRCQCLELRGYFL